jgi:mRNA-degrading endonuclease RelE of RelBE toxin-antitoxin system
VEKFKVLLKKSAIRQLKFLPSSTQIRIQNAMIARLSTTPFLADGRHIKKLKDGYRLRIGNYRVFYYIESKNITVTSIVRRTSKTY